MFILKIIITQAKAANIISLLFSKNKKPFYKKKTNFSTLHLSALKNGYTFYYSKNNATIFNRFLVLV